MASNDFLDDMFERRIELRTKSSELMNTSTECVLERARFLCLVSEFIKNYLIAKVEITPQKEEIADNVWKLPEWLTFSFILSEENIHRKNARHHCNRIEKEQKESMKHQRDKMGNKNAFLIKTLHERLYSVQLLQRPATVSCDKAWAGEEDQ